MSEDTRTDTKALQPSEDKSLKPGEDKTERPNRDEIAAVDAGLGADEASDGLAVVFLQHHNEGGKSYVPGDEDTLPAQRANSLVASKYARLKD